MADAKKNIVVWPVVLVPGLVLSLTQYSEPVSSSVKWGFRPDVLGVYKLMAKLRLGNYSVEVQGWEVGTVRAPLSHLRSWQRLQFPPFLCFSFRTILTVVLPASFGRKWRGRKPRGALGPVGLGVLGSLFLPPSPEHGSWECLCKGQEGCSSPTGHCQCRSSQTEAVVRGLRMARVTEPDGPGKTGHRLRVERRSGWGRRCSQAMGL